MTTSFLTPNRNLVAQEFRERDHQLQEKHADAVPFKNQIIREINKQRAAYSEDLKILQEQREILSVDLERHADLLRNYKVEIEKLRNQVGELEKDKIAIQETHARDINELRGLINKEKELRENAFRKLVKEVSTELRGVHNRIMPDLIPENARFKVYKVEKGDTLGAIAVAFNVSLSTLKTANELQSDIIYVGQELKIPTNEK